MVLMAGLLRSVGAVGGTQVTAPAVDVQLSWRATQAHIILASVGSEGMADLLGASIGSIVHEINPATVAAGRGVTCLRDSPGSVTD